MTVDEYYAIVRRLGLSPTNVPHVFRSADGDCHNMPDPTRHTEAQRTETIERLKSLLGIGKMDE
jgi:hypothetical protein